jgi:6-phosphogluconolactonase
MHCFWSDERCVPPNDPESNYGQAHQHLLSRLPVAARQVHRIRGEEPAEAAASLASRELHEMLPAASNGRPVFDLILLGMGEDGHVASLFPGQTTLKEDHGSPYRAVHAPKPPPHRVTLSYPVIEAAREAWVLVSGRNKETALVESLTQAESTPLARVLHRRTQTVIFTDVGVERTPGGTFRLIPQAPLPGGP